MKPSYRFVVSLIVLPVLSILFTQTFEGKEETPQAKAEVRITSLTVFPVNLAGAPYKNIAEALGLILEKNNFRKLAIADAVFAPEKDQDFDQRAAAFGAFVKSHPIQTDFALYGEVIATPDRKIAGVRDVVVDKSGKVVWIDVQTPETPAFKKAKPDCPLTCCVLMGERIAPMLVQADPSQLEEPGPMERLWAEKSGTPEEKEWKAMESRQELLKKNFSRSKICVFPCRVNDKVNRASAEGLVKLLTDDKVCAAEVAVSEPWFKIEPNSNEQRVLWDMAKAFQGYVREHAPEADYVLYADYLMNVEKGHVGAVHFVVCDRKGDWVIVDYQNNHHDDFNSVAPKSVEDCDRLVVKRLEGYVNG